MSGMQGSQVGPYRIERRLGSGGMGVVYLGRDDAGVLAAVKLIRPEHLAEPEFRARLAREVEAAQRVPRFCTAPVLAADLAADPPWVATEYIGAPTLDVLLLERGQLADVELESFAVGVAAALRAIHEQGIVHRDLKPSNVLCSGLGPRVIDFGIARVEDGTQLTQTGAVVGTVAYMAPEQLRGEPVTSAVDVFAWASLVVYAATGRPPFGPGQQAAQGILHKQPELGNLTGPLREAVAAAFDKDPDARPSAVELLERLLPQASPATTRMLATATEPGITIREDSAPYGSPVPPGSAMPATAVDQSLPWVRYGLTSSAVRVLRWYRKRLLRMPSHRWHHQSGWLSRSIRAGHQLAAIGLLAATVFFTVGVLTWDFDTDVSEVSADMPEADVAFYGSARWVIPNAMGLVGSVSLALAMAAMTCVVPLRLWDRAAERLIVFAGGLGPGLVTLGSWPFIFGLFVHAVVAPARARAGDREQLDQAVAVAGTPLFQNLFWLGLIGIGFIFLVQLGVGVLPRWATTLMLAGGVVLIGAADTRPGVFWGSAFILVGVLGWVWSLWRAGWTVTAAR